MQPLSHSPTTSRKKAKLHLEVLTFKSLGGNLRAEKGASPCGWTASRQKNYQVLLRNKMPQFGKPLCRLGCPLDVCACCKIQLHFSSGGSKLPLPLFLISNKLLASESVSLSSEGHRVLQRIHSLHHPLLTRTGPPNPARLPAPRHSTPTAHPGRISACSAFAIPPEGGSR